MRHYLQILSTTTQQWMEDKSPQLAAALAFYSLLSLGPLLLIAIAIAGAMFGTEAATGQIVGQIEGLLGKSGAEAVQSVIANSRKPSSNLMAAVIGVVTLLIGASGVFGQLQDSLNVIWKAPARPVKTIWYTVKNRLLSFAMVLGVGFLLMISLLLSAILAAMGTYFIGILPRFAPMLEVINNVVTLGVVTLLFAMIFKVLPDIRIQWRDVWGGAFLSAVLFTIGKYLIGLYLGSSAIGTTYGAAGSFVVLALWVYYSALILFFGAELAYTYSGKFHTEPPAPAPK